MEVKLTKAEFMKKVINDRYAKRLKEKLKDQDIYGYTIANIHKVKRRKRII